MEDRVFKTITKESEGFYKEKGSKFYSHAFPVNDLEEVKSELEALQKKYHDARHHCYAYIIENDPHQLIRANDDGEPNHSAGDPILGQIKSFELTNTLIVVVRYFGGTKLGVSGLIHAYKTAAEDALSHNQITRIEIKSKFKLHFAYDVTNEIMRLIQQFNVDIVNQEYLDSCTIQASIKPSLLKEFKSKIQLVQGAEIIELP